MPIGLIPGDLSPGDSRAREFDFADLTIDRIRSTRDPLFRLAYDRLWEEFGSKHEIERQSVLEKRFAIDPATVRENTWMMYEMLIVRRDEAFAAVRDHTAIVHKAANGDINVVVHLSHLLIDKAFRKTGLAGWMRAFPLQTARDVLAASGHARASTTALVAEMEMPHPAHPDRLIRLRAYEKAGFSKIDPKAIPFIQPDFRDPATIDLTGGPQPLPMALIVRRVGREAERVIPAREVRSMVKSLYHMYAAAFREADMRQCFTVLKSIPNDETPIRLLPPTGPDE